jgi:hypothetical protein
MITTKYKAIFLKLKTFLIKKIPPHKNYFNNQVLTNKIHINIMYINSKLMHLTPKEKE